MRKTKRWKLEGCYHGGGTKFDRNFVKNFEGTHIPIHRFRDRRNWRGTYAWVPSKYTEGLLQKYLNKPIRDLEEAFNRRAKDIKNHCSFRKAYSTIIYGISQIHYWKASKYYKYIIVDDLVVRNPEYESHKYRNSYKFNTYQRTYNSKHIINPGAIRSKPIKSDWEFTANSYMKDLRPIYLGKLYVLLSNSLHLVDVYHYYKNFPEWRLEKDPALRIKKENFNKEWINADIGLNNLDWFIEEPNPNYEKLLNFIKFSNNSDITVDAARLALKYTCPTIMQNYGLGKFLNPVCKRKDIEKISTQ